MNKKIAILAIASLPFFQSCVSTKIYDDLKDKYDVLKAENESLMARLDEAQSGSSAYELEKLNKEVERLKQDKNKLAMDLQASDDKYNRLKTSYDALEQNSSASLSDNLALNRKLLEELNEKEKALQAEGQRLEQLRNELEQRSKRVAELEAIIASKETQMNSLKNAISKALTNFEGKGLTVEQRDGKVYVSMENKLLFKSGSWQVNEHGREAVVALAVVLANNEDINVLIEGHTDNVPYSGNSVLTSNWDLSTKRATAIVEILTENSAVKKENLTAAGRGEYAPLTTNETKEGRAKNRRIEVILTPKLDEITKLLNDIE